MQDSQGGGESDPAEGVRRRCVKNSPSFLSCIGKRTKEGCDLGSKVEIVYNETVHSLCSIDYSNFTQKQCDIITVAILYTAIQKRTDFAIV